MKTNLVRPRKNNPYHSAHLTEHVPTTPGKAQKSQTPGKMGYPSAKLLSWPHASCLHDRFGHKLPSSPAAWLRGPPSYRSHRKRAGGRAQKTRWARVLSHGSALQGSKQGLTLVLAVAFTPSLRPSRQIK